MSASVHFLNPTVGSYAAQYPVPEYPKIARFSKEVIVTEKIDGANGLVHVNDTMTDLLAGSRTKWVTLDDPDDFGFARFVDANKEELLKLGPGDHYGEWWGSGMMRRYGLKEKRFSLFNTHLWTNDATRPACCHVVPMLWRGPLADLDADAVLAELAARGSVAAPGFMNPEGIVVFHTGGQWLLKKTFDDKPKGAS